MLLNNSILKENIRKFRIEIGYSQEYMASLLGISQQAYSHIEKNPENTSFERLRKIADILDVALVELIDQPLNELSIKALNELSEKNNLENVHNESFERIIRELKEEIVFLRKLISVQISSNSSAKLED